MNACLMMVSASVFNLNAALSACLSNTTQIHNNKKETGSSTKRPPTDARGQEVWSMSENKSNLYEIVAEGAREREWGWLCVINQSKISKMKPIILAAEIQEL